MTKTKQFFRTNAQNIDTLRVKIQFFVYFSLFLDSGYIVKLYFISYLRDNYCSVTYSYDLFNISIYVHAFRYIFWQFYHNAGCEVIIFLFLVTSFGLKY